MLEVVAALICREDKYLICKRAAHKSNGGLWEFPGGKIEAGETPQAALQRECAEELAVQLTVGEMLLQVTHSYPHATIHLQLFACMVESGEPQPLEPQQICWVSRAELAQYQFSPADQYFVEKLI